MLSIQRCCGCQSGADLYADNVPDGEVHVIEFLLQRYGNIVQVILDNFPGNMKGSIIVTGSDFGLQHLQKHPAHTQPLVLFSVFDPKAFGYSGGTIQRGIFSEPLSLLRNSPKVIMDAVPHGPAK